MKSSNLESLELNTTKAPIVQEPIKQGLCGLNHKAISIIKSGKEVNMAKFR